MDFKGHHAEALRRHLTAPEAGKATRMRGRDHTLHRTKLWKCDMKVDTMKSFTHKAFVDCMKEKRAERRRRGLSNKASPTVLSAAAKGSARRDRPYGTKAPAGMLDSLGLGLAHADRHVQSPPLAPVASPSAPAPRENKVKQDQRRHYHDIKASPPGGKAVTFLRPPAGMLNGCGLGLAHAAHHAQSPPSAPVASRFAPTSRESKIKRDQKRHYDDAGSSAVAR